MNRRIIRCLMLAVLTLQSVTAMGAGPIGTEMGTDMMSQSMQQMHHHDCADQSASQTDVDAPAMPPDCCDDGCAAQMGCATSCAVYFVPASPPLMLPVNSNNESFAFVARIAFSRDYPPLNPPPNA